MTSSPTDAGASARLIPLVQTADQGRRGEVYAPGVGRTMKQFVAGAIVETTRVPSLGLALLPVSRAGCFVCHPRMILAAQRSQGIPWRSSHLGARVAFGSSLTEKSALSVTEIGNGIAVRGAARGSTALLPSITGGGLHLDIPQPVQSLGQPRVLCRRRGGPHRYCCSYRNREQDILFGVLTTY